MNKNIAAPLCALFAALFALWACNVESPPGSRTRQLKFDHIADSLAQAGYDSLEITVTGGGLSAPLSLYNGPISPITPKLLPESLGESYQVILKAFDKEKPGLVFKKVYAVTDGRVDEGGITIIPEPDPGTEPDPRDTVPTGVRLDPGALSLADNGDTSRLKATVIPVTAKQNVVWKTGNAGVATVDAEGLVRSVGVGVAMITAQAAEDATKQASIEVTVSKPVAIEGIDLDSAQLKLYVGGPAATLNASIRPVTAPRLLNWESTNASVASVNAEGKVTGLAAGMATVKAQYKSDKTKEAVCLVTVIKDVPVLWGGEDVSVETGATVTFAPKVTQEFGGIVAFKWSLDGDTIWDETATAVPATLSRTYTAAADVYAYFSVQDGEGNIALAKRLIRVGSTSPLVSIAEPANGAVVNTATVTLTYRINNVVHSRQQELVEGSNTVKVDTVINGKSGIDSIEVILDTKKPVVVITAPVDGRLTKDSSVAVAWTVDGTAQTAQLTQALLLEGENAIVRSATDAAGNVGSATVKVRRDTRPPVVIITSPGDGSVTNLAVIPVAWTVDGAAQTVQLTQALAADGEHTIQRTATDSAGNQGTASVKVVRNTQAPLVVITSPVNGLVTNLKVVPVAWTVDGVAQTTQLTQALAIEGENSITREATSPGGTKGSSTVKVIRDTLAPRVLITSPANGLVTKDSLVTLAWTVDGVAQTAQLTHKLAAEGPTTILREATDAAGNKGSASVSVTLDTKGPTAPAVSGVSPTMDATPTWSWVSGGGGGNGTFRYRLDNADLATGATTVTTLTFTPTANLADGIHTLYIQERDEAGNWSPSKSHPIQIDATAPTVAITSPTSAATFLTNKASLFISGTAADAGGVSSVTYALTGQTSTTPQAATGTTAWSFTASALNDGLTLVIVTARDAMGNSKSDTLAVTRRANVVFVRADAVGGDGSNWASAFKNLPEALASLTSGQIWVAQGTYKPTTGTDRTIAFQMKNGVNLYGGFAGTETALNLARNTQATPSILSGEIGPAGPLGNSFSVVIGANATLDGFTVRDANSEVGGGISIINVNMTISNCIIRNNNAVGGGGVNLDDADAIFRNCLFMDNGSAGSADAALRGISEVQFINCSFSNIYGTTNSIGINGNGTSGLIVTIRNCIFWAAVQSNTAISAGVGTVNLSHTILQGGTAEGFSGGQLRDREHRRVHRLQPESQIHERDQSPFAYGQPGHQQGLGLGGPGHGYRRPRPAPRDGPGFGRLRVLRRQGR